MNETIYHVVPHGDEWAVKRQGNGQASRVLETKDEAIEQAQTFALNQAPSALVIHGSDGTIQSRRTFDVGDARDVADRTFTGLLRHPAAVAGAVVAAGLIGFGAYLVQQRR